MPSPLGLRDRWARHRERNRPTGIGFAISDSIRYLDPGGWDELVRGKSVFLSRDYLVALEESRVEGIAPRYALLFEGSKPVAAFTAQILRCKPDSEGAPEPGAESLVVRVKKAVTKRLKQQAMSSMLTTGNAFAWTTSGVAIAADADPARVWPAVAEGLLRIRRADRLTGHTDLIVVKDLPAELRAQAEPLTRFSYRAVARDPDMVLEIPPAWRSEQDYLAQLSSKYRKAALTMDRELEAAGCRFEPLADVASRADRIHALYLAVREKARVRGPALPASYFPALQQALGERFRVSVLRCGEDILGFVSTIHDGETAVGYLVGVDYEANAKLPVYLRLLRGVIGDALALGCRRISYGGTALEPKSRLGARPVPLTLYVRHRNPVINAMFRDVLAALEPDQPPDRTPFKT